MAQIILAQCRGELANQAAVTVDQARVERHDVIGCGQGRKFGGDCLAFRLERGDAFGHPLTCDMALGDLINQPVQLGEDRRLAPVEPHRPLPLGSAKAGAGGMILLDVSRDRGRIEQLLLQSRDDAMLELGQLDRRRIVAGAALVTPGATELVPAAHHIAGAADRAAQQSREGMARSPAAVCRATGVAGVPRLRGIPGRVVDDAQLGHDGDDPLAAGIGARQATSGFRVLDEVRPVVDEPAGIDLVPENAGAAVATAADRRGAPCAAARARNPVAVQPLGDGTRAAAGDVLGIDAAHDRGFFGIDRAAPAHQLATAVDLAHQAIAVGEAARHRSGQGPAHLAAPHLGSEVLQEQRVHRALEADVQFADLALGGRQQPDTGELQPLEDRGDVLLVTGQPIEGFDQDGVEMAGPRLAKQPRRLGPGAQAGAGQRVIGEDGDDIAERRMRRVLAAQPHLVVYRVRALDVVAVARVDGDAHPGSRSANSRGISPGASPAASVRWSRAARARASVRANSSTSSSARTASA